MFKKMMQLSVVGIALTAVGLIIAPANAAIVAVGDSSGYDVTNNGNWDTPLPTVWGDWDIDGDNQLGSAGFFFFGAFDGTTDQSGKSWATGNYVSDLPAFVTSVTAGANFNKIAWGFSSYGQIDDPVNRDQANLPGGIATSTQASQGDFRKLLKFTIDDDHPVGLTIRVGVLGGIEWNSNGRWNPTAYQLSDDNANIATVTGLAIAAAEPSWVFFDIDRPGTYYLAGQQRLSTQGASVGGLTFDVVPEPGSAMLLLIAAACGLLVRRRRGKD